MIDDTLGNLGKTTNYHKLQTRNVWLVTGWCIMYILIMYLKTLWFANIHHVDTSTAVHFIVILNYCHFVNIIGDIIIASILG